MAARVCEIAEAVRQRLEDEWPEGDTPIPTFVVDDDWHIETIDELAEITDRYVVVTDEGYRQVEQTTHAEDTDEYTIRVSFIERYVDAAGRVPTAWKEARKALVQDNLFRVLNDHRAEANNGNPLGSSYAGVWPETCEMETVMDRELIINPKVFVSVIEVAYRELRAV